MWCSAADAHLQLLDRVVSDVSFLTLLVFECDLASRRSVSYLVCCTRSDVTRYTPERYVPVRVSFTRGAVIAHRNTYAPRSSRTSQHHSTFISLSVSLWNDLGDPVFDGVGLAGFKSRANAFFVT